MNPQNTHLYQFGKLSLAFALLMSLWLAFTALPAYAQGPCFVESTGDNVTDFQSADATAVQNAVDAASSDDTLKVAGTCAGINVRNALSQTVYISQSLTLQGGYTHTNWLAPANPAIYTTTLDAQSLGRVVLITDTAAAQIKDLTITGGNERKGGGLFIAPSASLMLNNSRVISNSVLEMTISDGGGGLGNLGQTVISGTIFSHNTAAIQGGGVGNGPSGRLVISNSLFSYNTANRAGALGNTGLITVTNSNFMNNAAGSGGAIGNLQDLGGPGWMRVENSTFISNTGKAIDNDGGELHLIGSTFIGNSGSSGGAIYNNSGASGLPPVLVISNTTFMSNTATGGHGGALRNRTGSSHISNSSFAYNTADDNGGAIEVRGGEVYLINSTISHNTARFNGGGLFNRGLLSLLQTTVTSNTAPSGSGVSNTGSATTNISATILSDNSGGNDCNASTGTWQSGGYNLLGASCTFTVSSDIVTDAPLLGPLTDNGGETLTHALLNGSPTIDHIPAGDCAVNEDQRGIARPQINGCDIGAYEANPQTTPNLIVNTAEDSDDGWCEIFVTGIGDCTLREAIKAGNANGTASITFADNYTITLAGTQLPPITVPITITGFGITNTIVQADVISKTATNRVFEVASSGNLTLNSLTVQNGRCKGACPTAARKGGGIYIDDGGILTINNSLIADNQVQRNGSRGGGIYASVGSTLTGYNSLFIRNMAKDDGGAIYNAGTMSINDATFDKNGKLAFDISGGAIGNKFVMTVTNSIFTNNLGDLGGAIYNYDNTSGMSSRIVNSTFTGNEAKRIGGAIYHGGGLLLITNSTLNNNLASSDGGAISNDAPMTIINSTLSGNTSSGSSGAIYHTSDTAVLINVSIANNTSDSDSASLVNENGTIIISNTLIVGETTGSDCADDGGVFWSATNSLDSDGSCAALAGGFTQASNIGLGTLADNGGATLSHALLPGSDAINAGDNSICADPNTVNNLDQRGVVRPQGSACDIGAFESQGFYLSLVGGNNQTTEINTPFAQPLQVSLIASDTTVSVGAGHTITYTAPLSGASLSPASGNGTVAFGVFTATTNLSGTASLSSTANGIGGSYGVVATSQSAWNSVTFNLTNTVHFSLSLNIVGSGSVTPTGGSYLSGTVVSLSAMPADDWQFDGWSGSIISATSPISLTMDNNKVITATFSQVITPPVTYTLSVFTAGDGSGTVDLNPAGNVYIAGTVVTLTATADNGSSFGGWTGAIINTDNPTVITMDSDKVVTATFSTVPPVTYTLSVSTVGSGTVTLNPAGGSYLSGTVVSLNAMPNAGWQFEGWSGSVISATNPISLTMDADRIITATFSQVITPPVTYTLSIFTSGDGSGTVDLNPAGNVYLAGTVVTLTATADNGSSFGGWTGAIENINNPTIITMDSDKVVTATFEMSDTSQKIYLPLVMK